MAPPSAFRSNENASPDVPLDLNDSLDRLVPDGDKMRYRHDDEGPDDMPAHVKSSQSHLCSPFFSSFLISPFKIVGMNE